MSNAEKCSKCGLDLDTDGTPKWCKKCRATYQREYNATKEGRAEAAGFARGVMATKGVLASEFSRLGNGQWSGYEIANLIARAPGPKFDEQPPRA